MDAELPKLQVDDSLPPGVGDRVPGDEKIDRRGQRIKARYDRRYRARCVACVSNRVVQNPMSEAADRNAGSEAQKAGSGRQAREESQGREEGRRLGAYGARLCQHPGYACVSQRWPWRLGA